MGKNYNDFKDEIKKDGITYTLIDGINYSLGDTINYFLNTSLSIFNREKGEFKVLIYHKKDDLNKFEDLQK